MYVCVFAYIHLCIYRVEGGSSLMAKPAVKVIFPKDNSKIKTGKESSNKKTLQTCKYPLIGKNKRRYFEINKSAVCRVTSYLATLVIGFYICKLGQWSKSRFVVCHYNPMKYLLLAHNLMHLVYFHKLN